MSSPEHIGETLKNVRESNSASPSLYKLLSLNFNGVSPSTLKLPIAVRRMLHPIVMLLGRELPPFEQQHDSRTETESVLLDNPHIPFQMTDLYLFYHNCLVTAFPMLYKCRLFLSQYQYVRKVSNSNST